ncbi:MAG: hypothetical protein LCH84_14805 [Gemmatimonadetes bacterium]|nr:hypothetical protein [Gemmatimonadota bacterium]
MMGTGRRVVTWGATALLLLLACRGARVPVEAGLLAAALPGDAPRVALPSVDGELARTLVCADSLGRQAARFPTRRCLPCLPQRAQDGAPEAVEHARTLWARAGGAPWAADDSTARCVSVAWARAAQIAAFDPSAARWMDTPDVLVDRTRFQLSSTDPSTRTAALDTLDAALARHLATGDSAWVRDALEHLARAMWTKAQALLARPAWRLSDEESAARGATPMPTLRVLPPYPARSDTVGATDAEWSARLFDRLAQLAPTTERATWHRLALAPWVAMRRWNALNSAAQALLQRAPGDSVVLPARALAAYHRIVRPVLQAERVNALFDEALRAMAPEDSARHDSFDGVFARSDDEWRAGFLPLDRARLETRGWFVLDPLWSTPVNEVRLARRARVVTADFLYADIAPPGTSGSTTAAGRLLVRRGPPTPRWTTAVRSSAAPFQRLRGGWDGLEQTLEIEQTDELWRVIHGGQFTWPRVADHMLSPLAPPCAATQGAPADTLFDAPYASFVDCAERDRARWKEVPFLATMVPIDVIAARFRAGRDSTDIYLGASVPLASFRGEATGSRAAERLQLTAFLGRPDGDVHWSRSDTRVRPSSATARWTTQWSPRVPNAEWLHRVELLDPARTRGARGAMTFTSAGAVQQSMRGFGMSDLLVAAASRTRVTLPRRWSDYELTPNGGVVAPRTPFVVLWELYDLQPDAQGRVRWQVEVRREQGAEVARVNVRDVLRGAPRANALLEANEPEAAELRYTREAPRSAAVVEQLRLPLPVAATPGRHVLRLRVTDLVSGAVVERAVGVRLEAR